MMEDIPGRVKIGDGSYVAARTWCPDCGNERAYGAGIGMCRHCGFMGFTSIEPRQRMEQKMGRWWKCRLTFLGVT
jgi:hypothetical protein